MSDSFLKSMTLFFYYFFLDEGLTIKATKKFLKKQKTLLSKQPSNKNLSIPSLIALCLWVCQKYQKYRFKKTFYFFKKGTQNHFMSPVDLSPWQNFLKEAESDVVTVVIFSKILLFQEEDIAKGMKISLGTVRYRLGYGLRLLGGMYASEVESL